MSDGNANFLICRFETVSSTTAIASKRSLCAVRASPPSKNELAAGKKFRGFSLNDNDPFGNRTLSPEDAQRIEEEVIRDAFERGQVVVPLTGQEMNNRLLTLYRRARSDMQEGGTNTLFLAAGFLRWKKTEGDTRTYRAPLVLIPVRLERRSAQSPFRITHHEDDVRINSTLLEFPET